MNFPMPNDTLDGSIVVASQYATGSDALVLLLDESITVLPHRMG